MDGLYDTYMKTLVYEISYLRNLQYDIDRISKKVNELDYSSDITSFEKNNIKMVYLLLFSHWNSNYM